MWCPGLGWIDADPTNNVLPGERHITVAWGRDFSDVSPLRGVVVGGGEHGLGVSVDVARTGWGFLTRRDDGLTGGFAVFRERRRLLRHEAGRILPGEGSHHVMHEEEFPDDGERKDEGIERRMAEAGDDLVDRRRQLGPRVQEREELLAFALHPCEPGGQGDGILRERREGDRHGVAVQTEALRAVSVPSIMWR